MPRVTVEIPVFLPTWLHRPLKAIKSRRRDSRTGPDLIGDRDVEWSWVEARMPRGPGEALDFGAGDSHLSLVAAQNGFNVLAVDLLPLDRPYEHPLIRQIQGDLLELDLRDETFDLVINCSTVEHVGLVGRYGVDKRRDEGDLEVMRRLSALMKPGAKMLLTVPLGQDAVFPPLCRVYGEHRLPRLLEPFEVEDETYWVKNSANKWILDSRKRALEFPASAGSWDPRKNSYAIGCFELKKR